MKDCTCGSKGYLQDFGFVFWVKCKSCGLSSPRADNRQDAIEKWDSLNINSKPTTFCVRSGSEFNELIARQNRGEIVLHSLEYMGNASYIVQISYA